LPNCHLHIKGLRRRHPDYWITTQAAVTEPKTLGERIRNRRLELHLLQKELAAQFGCNIESLKNWERGVYQPGDLFLPQVRVFLGDEGIIHSTPAPRPGQILKRSK